MIDSSYGLVPDAVIPLKEQINFVLEVLVQRNDVYTAFSTF